MVAAIEIIRDIPVNDSTKQKVVDTPQKLTPEERVEWEFAYAAVDWLKGEESSKDLTTIGKTAVPKGTDLPVSKPKDIPVFSSYFEQHAPEDVLDAIEKDACEQRKTIVIFSSQSILSK